MSADQYWPRPADSGGDVDGVSVAWLFGAIRKRALRRGGAGPNSVCGLLRMCTRCVPEPKLWILNILSKCLQPSEYGPFRGAPAAFEPATPGLGELIWASVRRSRNAWVKCLDGPYLLS